MQWLDNAFIVEKLSFVLSFEIYGPFLYTLLLSKYCEL